MASGIQIRDVRYRYPGGRVALEGIDFDVDPGDYLFICGPNGSGKSTAACLMNGLIPHFFGGDFEGSVIVFGKDSRDASVSELFPAVGLVLQNADAQLFNSTVEDELAFGLESLGLDPETMRQKIGETADFFQIEHLLARSPEELSGGEKRLAGVASIFCLSPSVMVLDEPYANLDRKSAARVRRGLKKVHGQGTTVVVVEQRLEECLEDARRCIVMDKGKILFDGAPAEAEKVLALQGLSPDYSGCRSAKHFAGANSKLGPDDEKEKTPLLKIEKLSRRIDGRQILKNVSLEIRRGEAAALVGKNGSGKTTLVKHLNGLYRPGSGGVFFDGENIEKKPTARLAAMAGLSFQNPNDQFFKSRVIDELRVGLALMRGDRRAWLDRICQAFDLYDLLERPPFKLSEGEKKRAAVCSILAMDPRLLVLDEPTAGQDGRSRQILAEILCDLNRQGRTILVATHDLDFARAVADRWIVLENGTVAGDGPSGDFERGGKTAFERNGAKAPT